LDKFKLFVCEMQNQILIVFLFQWKLRYLICIKWMTLLN